MHKQQQQQQQPHQQVIIVNNETGGEVANQPAPLLSDAAVAAVCRACVTASPPAAATNAADTSATPCSRSHPWCTTGAHVLDVGSGTGIQGITAAGLGAHVTLTDLPELQPLLSANVAANQQLIEAAGGSANVQILDWSNIDQMLGDLGCSSAGGSCSSSRVLAGEHLLQRQYDWAMGADLVFNQRQVMPVVHLIATLLGARPCSCWEPQHGAVKQCSGCAASQAGLLQKQQERQQCVVQSGFLLAHKHRHELVDEQFTKALTGAGLKMDTWATTHVEGRPEQHASVGVWWLTRMVTSKYQQQVEDISFQQLAKARGMQR